MTANDDRDSVLSAETWQPTSLSAWLSLLLTLLVAGWIATVTGLVAPVAVAAGGGVVAAVSVAVTAGDQNRHALAGSLLFVVTAGGFAGSLAFALTRQPLDQLTLPVLPGDAWVYFPTGSIVICLTFFGVLGGCLGIRDRLDIETVRATIPLSLSTVVPLDAAAMLAFFYHDFTLDEVSQEFVEGGLALYQAVLTPSSPGLVMVAGLMAVLAGTIRLLLFTDPLARFHDDERLGQYRRLERRLRRLSTASLFGFALITVLLGAWGDYELLRTLRSLPPWVRAGLLAVGTTVLVRGLLLWTALLCVALAAVTAVGRRLARLDRWTIAWLGSRTAGAIAVLAGIGGGLLLVDYRPLLDAVLAQNPALLTVSRTFAPELVEAILFDERGAALLFAVVVGALVAVLLFWWSVLGALYAMLRTGVHPTRGGGHALAAACTFGLAVSASIAGASPFVLFGGVALAFAVWDLGEFSVNVGEEVGRRASTSHGELVHAGAAFGIGGGAIGATLVLSRLSTPAPADQLGGLVLVALLSAVAGLALLSAVTRA